MSEEHTILAVDDNPDALYALERILVHKGYQVVTASSGEQALECARKKTPSVLLLDVMMPFMDGYEVTQQFKDDAELRFVPVILVTAKDSLEDVVDGLDKGADGYITKPFRPEELLARVRAALRLRDLYEELRATKEENTSLRRKLSGKYSFDNIVGESTPMRQVFSLLEKVIDADTPVLITGASGTGKELIAKAIHFHSKRKDGPFVAKNCAAFTESLLESELFGHVRGAFTGALQDKKGLFQAAHKGTLFLDEIGEMSPVLQAKLLRVLQEGAFTPVGSTVETNADVRVLAATNRNLSTMVDEGKFREDLYYRLNVIDIHLPPLSERRVDIPLLVRHFLSRIADERGDSQKELSVDAMDMLSSYSWRGNVRELENEIERLLILAGDSPVLESHMLSPRILEEHAKRQKTDVETTPDSGTLRQAVEDLERRMIIDTLQQTSWNKTNAAKALGMSRSNLISKVQQYGLESEQK